MNFDDIKKLPGLLEALVTKVPQEIEAGVMRGVSGFENRIKALEDKTGTVVAEDFDAKVKTALSDIFGADFDLSGLETALESFGSAVAPNVPNPAPAMPVEAPAPLPIAPLPADPVAMPDPAPLGGSKKVDLSSLFSAGPVAVDPAKSPATVGSADTSTTTVGNQGSQDPAASEPKPASVPQKVDPATAGALAATAAADAGDDAVSAAAKAAHAAAVELGVDPVSAATKAAAAAGAGSVEALRAAQNADLAANQGQAPATS